MPFFRKIICSLLLVLCATSGYAADLARIDALIGDAIGRNLIAGGVVLVGSRDRILFEKAYGRISPLPDAPLMAVDTIFDIASLTKVAATTPSVLKLAEEGRISLIDPVVKWFPEMAGHGKDSILVLHLLTHTSGLDDVQLYGDSPIRSAIEGAATQKLKGEVGSRFRYADLNFILLAELVRRATGAPLDVYTQASFYRPLGMTDTCFNPKREGRFCATLTEGRILMGEVQDPLCRQLGGVAGHAGLFSTARDLGRLCRMMLGGGTLDGRRVLAARTVDQMTAPYFSRGGGVVRGLGWDISSPFSSPRGNGFSRISFGHTGYSGTSIWIDPASDTFVILLTARLDYKNTHEFNKLRGDLSTVASQLFGIPPELGEMARFNDE
ncbi:metal-dependent hydrolase, beta-lactamase superfamily [Citrifermentans bemidjiense Bem]|uniref:Metal-dependent hydrolase, beta-lactamase superfamily n=1 Tax=Citrifermentans bemidjiense (strain ATCC BAA-1014 / DSM 16622 / JCM 12645 / Bem) TaxID=404380 RepID=B5E811_CITBB|nr:serine hydrolase domain-containing protein [Citrifermentans bemidjiense]ACH38547.1 metal-dependent hydrolase, beta-lactamase superfamily [Citrifermentans bemidjiense Bem]